MYSLNLPKYPLKITEKNGKYYVFDLLRRKKSGADPGGMGAATFCKLSTHREKCTERINGQ